MLGDADKRLVFWWPRQWRIFQTMPIRTGMSRSDENQHKSSTFSHVADQLPLSSGNQSMAQ
jgi:hypothetical protein